MVAAAAPHVERHALRRCRRPSAVVAGAVLCLADAAQPGLLPCPGWRVRRTRSSSARTTRARTSARSGSAHRAWSGGSARRCALQTGSSSRTSTRRTTSAGPTSDGRGGAGASIRRSARAPGRAGRAAGDFNVLSPRLPGYSEPGPGIDHVLVRGAPATPVSVWPADQRTVAGVLLSDHAPVEVRVG